MYLFPGRLTDGQTFCDNSIQKMSHETHQTHQFLPRHEKNHDDEMKTTVLYSKLCAVIVASNLLAFGCSSSSAFGSTPSSTPVVPPAPQQQQGASTANARNNGFYISKAQAEHDEEFQRGAETFGVSGEGSDVNSARTGATTSNKKLDDTDFIAYDIGRGNAGPSESTHSNGNFVYQTKETILSEDECKYWIQIAKETIAKERAAEEEEGVTTGRPPSDGSRTNAQLGEARLSALPPAAIANLRRLLQATVYPILESRFGIDKISVYDGLILGSIAPARSQPVHRDAGYVTINIALSPRDDFVGGGTYIEGLATGGTTLVVDRGVALCHSSGAMHAGVGISNGERYQMVLFCLKHDEPQIARRCHKMGLDMIRDGDLNGAEGAFEAGLSITPNDHKLIMGRGQIFSMRGDDQNALRCLGEASEAYPLDHAPGIAMGKMQLAANQHWEAFQSFDTVLANIADRDQNDDAWMPLRASAYDARTTAVHCALLCAEDEASKAGDGPRPWSKEQLPIAIDRLHKSIAAAPQNGILYGMMDRAQELLNEANFL